jgi:hypothetical protein
MSTHQIDSTCFKTLDITVLLLTVFFNGSVSANYEAIKAGQNTNKIRVLSSNGSSCTIEIQLGAFHRKNISINGEVYNLLNLPTGSLIQEHGYPELPKISRSIISCTIVEQKYESYSPENLLEIGEPYLIRDFRDCKRSNSCLLVWNSSFWKKYC